MGRSDSLAFSAIVTTGVEFPGVTGLGSSVYQLLIVDVQLGSLPRRPLSPLYLADSWRMLGNSHSELCEDL